MLILLCVLFPPFIPFAILFSLVGNRNANRQIAASQKQANHQAVVAQRQAAVFHKQAQIIQFAALTEEQKLIAVEGLRLEAKKRRDMIVGKFVLFVIGVILFMFFVGWVQHQP